MTAPVAGHTQQSSFGYLVTRDATSVRHEQPRNTQTMDMIRQPYTPLQKRPPRDIAAWQATLLAHPEDLHRDIAEREQQVRQLQDDAGAVRQGRSGASRFRRIMAGAASLPDQGNVKANSQKAIRLRGPAGSGASHGQARAGAHGQHAGYASMPDYLDVLGLTQRRKQVSHLQQETRELIDVLEDARAKAAELRKGRPLSDAAAIERQCLLDAKTRDDNAARDALRQRVVDCDELSAAIGKNRKRQERLSRLKQDTTLEKTSLVYLQARLGKTEEMRDVALGLQASDAADGMIHSLKQLEGALDQLAGDIGRDLQKAGAALDTAQREEIAQSLAALHGLDQRTDKDALRAFIRTRLAHCIDQACDVDAHAIPAPMLVDIYIGALSHAATPGAPLDAATHARAMELVASLPGGLLACEQITGTPFDKGRRVAHRVEALANTAQARLPAGAGAQPRRTVLTLAAQAAARVKTTGSDDGCSELQRASYNAVRNGFATGLDTGVGIDPRLTEANERLEKMLTGWISNASKSGPGLRNTMKGKSPFDDKTLALAAMTSTLGYDVPARPMARLDKNMREAVERLRAMVPQASLDAIAAQAESSKAVADLECNVGAIASGSLSAKDVYDLGALLLAARKSSEAENLRPGHVKLGEADADALLSLVQGRLGQLAREGEPAPDLAAARAYLAAHGEQAASPRALVDLVDNIKDHITVDPDSAAAAGSRQDLLDNVTTVRHLIALNESASIGSTSDLYDYLAPKVEQFELRGKLKTTAGGNGGISTKALTWPLDLDPGALALVLPVRGEIKGGGSRCAVFEIGFSTTGFEIFVGSETRRMTGAGGGVGVRVGYESVLSSGAGVDKTVTFERADTEGVWLRLPRAGDDEATRKQALAVLGTLLGRDAPWAGAGAPDPRIGKFLEHQGNPVMPRIVGELLARHPNLSISTVDTYREETLRNELAPAGALLTLAGGTGDDASRIQVLGGGVRTERRNKTYRQSDGSGFMRMTRSNVLSGGSAWGQGGVLNVNGLFAMDPSSSASQQLGGLGASRQFAETGVDTKLRYITRDGETNPVDTRIDIEDVNLNNHLKRVNGRQQELVTLGAEQIFKNASPKPPLHEQKRVAKQWLYDILEQAAEKSEGNSRHVFSISSCLKKSPAAVIDGLAAKGELARLRNDDGRASLAEQQRNEVLQRAESFQPWKVTTSERTSEARQFGWTFGANYTTTRKTEGQRGTSSYPA